MRSEYSGLGLFDFWYFSQSSKLHILVENLEIHDAKSMFCVRDYLFKNINQVV